MECVPISYDDTTTYFVSNTQKGSLKRCPQKWEWGYYSRKKAEKVFTKPFDFGNYSHSVMENLMQLEHGRRKEFISDHIETVGNVYDSYRRRLMKSTLSINDRLIRYDAISNTPSTEVRVGVRAPDSWFPVGYKKFLSRISGKEDQLDGIGFRGIVDYYGMDMITGQKTLVDWKSSKWSKKWGGDYLDQLEYYCYVAHINGWTVDEARLEFFEVSNIKKKGKKEIRDVDATKIIKPNIKYGRGLLYNILNDTVKALQRAHEGKPFKAIQSRECMSCGFNAGCLKSDIVSDYYYRIDTI